MPRFTVLATTCFCIGLTIVVFAQSQRTDAEQPFNSDTAAVDDNLIKRVNALEDRVQNLERRLAEYHESQRIAYRTVPFGPIVAKVQDQQSNRHRTLTLDLILVVNESDTQIVQRAVSDIAVQIKESICAHLADMTLQDLRGSAGQKRLRDSIAEKINQQLTRSQRAEYVDEILFSKFILD